MPELGHVLPRLEEALGAAEGEPRPLGGGLTNRNFRVRLGGEDLVVRLAGKDTAALGIDRATEVAATRAAHSLGFAPAVVLFLPEQGCIVTRFVPGPAVTEDALRRPELVARVGRALRAFHDCGLALPVSFDVPAVAEAYRAATLARGGTVPPAYADAQALATRIAAALRGPEHDPVPCHDDLLTANFIARGAGGGVCLVDWEYAGMGDRFFDLGNLAVNNGFADEDERLLLEAYFGADGATERRVAALRLMRLMSDVREAAWGVVQGVLSELDVDYAAYAEQHFARLRDGASDPRLERWLRAASA